MNVLLIGSGGREHAIAWKLAQSHLLDDLYIAPGNPGTAKHGTNVALPVPKTGAPLSEIEAYLNAVVDTARELNIDLVFVAPDDPLSWGLVDKLDEAGFPAFGPNKAADALEASKGWAKEFMARNGILHPRTATFDDIEEARAHVLAAPGRVVVKADGLAAGKGAIVTSNDQEAIDAIEDLMANRSAGDAGLRVVIEDRIAGREVSPHAFCDGKTFAPMPLSCDHKSVYDGGVGPNTGGMGVYSPPWWTTDEMEREAFERIVRPTVDGMAAEGTPFKGILYPNLMATEKGLQVLEYNARFGDPETQALLPRLKTDLLQIAVACIEGDLEHLRVEWEDNASVCVVLASAGYPGSYDVGFPITGFEALDPGIQVFHAGTRQLDDGTLVTNGGRVLSVVATADTLKEAREKAYRNVERIRFQGRHFRTDIGAQP
ncbi:MAG: phosphoribosylamine--glycine ligase [Dehalococcoidia bacterium]